VFGRPLSPEELDLIRKQIESMDNITAIDDEVRGDSRAESAAFRFEVASKGG
jgi:hypothetical protein